MDKRLKNRLIDQDYVAKVTERNRSAGDSIVLSAMSFLKDPEKRVRLEYGKCRYCYYLRKGAMAGQAITQWSCGVCLKDGSWANTNTPRICDDCSKKHRICVSCGADVHDRVARKFDPSF